MNEPTHLDLFSGLLWNPQRETYLSDMAGDVHGVSGYVDRGWTLGNSIVPQVAHVFAKAIYEILTK